MSRQHKITPSKHKNKYKKTTLHVTILMASAMLLLSNVNVLATDLIGFAAVDAMDQASTTGGADGPIVVVKTYEELSDYCGRTEPYTILIEGTLTGRQPISVMSDKTIIGRGANATITKFGFDIRHVSNLIIRNLRIVAAMDGIAMRHVHHVWIDHCDLSACGDGLIDITQASDYVTVSWCRFSQHNKTFLINSGTSEPRDIGKLNTTIHHCWWDGSDTRNPRAGYGKVHIFNCLYNNNKYGIGTHSQARVLAERNYFDQTNDAIFQNYEIDPASPFHGFCEDHDNLFDGCTGTCDADGVSFETGDYYEYAFELDQAVEVPALVKANAGVHEQYGLIPPLPIPGDGAIHVSPNTPLHWTPGEDAETYKVYFGTSDSPAYKTQTTERHFNPGPLEADTVYFWRVDTVTSTTTRPGDLWRFHTLPAQASVPTPANGERDIPVAQELHWLAGARTQSHQLYLGTTNPPAFVCNLNETRYAPESLDNDQIYYWRVDEVTDGGTVTGKVWHFSTQETVKAGPGRVEAESMLLDWGYYPENNEQASGGKVAAIDAVNGTLSYRHQGDHGTYDITVCYLDETDGSSPYSLFLNNILIGQWSANERLADDQFQSKTFASVYIAKNDEIYLVGSRQRNELGRVDYVETTRVEDGPEKPVFKVDLNQFGRKNSEVSEPGYLPWVVASRNNDVATFSNVKMTLSACSQTGDSLETGWSKAYVQAPYYARLANDGIQVSGDTTIEMRIAGLPQGTHTLQTYHNCWDSPRIYRGCPFNVYLNGDLVHENIVATNRVEANCNATVLMTTLEVTDETPEMLLRFEARRDATPDRETKGVYLNGFEINTPDLSKQAGEPTPEDGDLHANADNGTVTLAWKPAKHGPMVKQYLYVGTDYQTIADYGTSDTSHCVAVLNGTDTSYVIDGIYEMRDYYWRVDQMDNNACVTQGDTWSFRPRQLAFKRAQGYGRYASGGRGGVVVEVTNLNDSGPGSFRDAITRNIGPRTIVFNVSGIITLKSRLIQNQSHMTIAGQTAPGKGICIRSAPLGVGSESICRFIRARLGSGNTGDGMGMAGANNSILDHCSISWTIDEAFSSRNAHNITVQRTLISEALNLAGHKNYPAGTGHGYAATIGGDIASFHHNLLAHCYGRNWSLGGGLDGAGQYAGRLDIFNNVVYNWGVRGTDGGAHQVNFVNNYYKQGPSTTQYYMLNAQLEGLGAGSQSYYYAGNVMTEQDGTMVCDGTDNTCGRTYTLYNRQILNWEVFVDEPFFPSYAHIEKATDAYQSVLSDVGCTLPIFDEHDQRIIRETLNGSYTYSGSSPLVAVDAEFPELSSTDPTKNKGIIDNENDAGGYEDYPIVTRPKGFDSDHDGLPNWWEILYGSNPDSPQGDFSDSNADPDQNGYTALEEYLEWMSVPHFELNHDSPQTIDVSPFTVAFVNEPQYSIVKAEHVDIQWAASTAIITPHTDFHGITYLDFMVSDRNGSSMTRTIGLRIQ